MEDHNLLPKILIEHQVLKNLILNKSSEKITTPQRKFVTDKKTWTIKTEMIEKKCGLTYNKRIILDDMNTIPFGYDRNLL